MIHHISDIVIKENADNYLLLITREQKIFLKREGKDLWVET